jgi:hypothetical protein
MTSQFNYLVAREQTADHHRTAETQRRAAAAVKVARPLREVRLYSLRWNRSLAGLRKRDLA